MVEIKFRPMDWELLLDDFNDRVREGKYKKIDYSTWRRLRELSIEKEDIVVTMFFLIGTGILTGISIDGLEFDGDNEFTKYLLQAYNTSALNDYKIIESTCEILNDTITVLNDYQTCDIKCETVNGTATTSLCCGISNISNIENNEKFIDNKKEEENRNMKGFNFDFGPVNGNAVRVSMYGLAVQNKDGVFVSYDKDTKDIIDVDILNVNGEKFLYKMPVAINDVKIGDVVIHNHKPMIVLNIAVNNKSLSVVDVVEGEKKDIMLTKSPFGFNFATKVVNFLDGAFTATSDNPFGNMWMMFALSEDSDMSDILPLMMMSNSGQGEFNPMMMALMMSKGKNSDLLPLMMMMNMPKQETHKCSCGNCNHENGNERCQDCEK